MEIISIIIILFLFLSCYTWYFINFTLYKGRVNKMLEKVKPLDGELPIVGHIFTPAFRKLENSEDIYTLLSALTNDRIEDRRMWMFNVPVLFLSNIHTIEKILTNPNTVQKSHVYSLLGFNKFDGVFVAPASVWKRMRKRLNLTFNPKFYPHYINLMNYQARIFVAKLKWFYSRQEGSYLNIHPVVAKYLFDIITSTHFGINTKQQFNDGTDFVAETVRSSEMAFKRIMRPWLHSKTIYRTTELYKRCKAIMDSHKPVIEKLVTMSEAYQRQLDAKGNALGWKTYMLLSKDELEERGMVSPSALRIGYNMSDLVIAGADTTAVTTSYVLYYIAKHPEYQEKAYNEITQLLQDETINDSNQIEIDNFVNNIFNNKMNQTKDSKEEEMMNQSKYENEWEFVERLPDNYATWTKSRLDRLNFLDALIKEAIRLYSPPAIIRYLKTDVDVGDYIIPKGTHVAIVINNVQRNPMYWEKPDEFYPEHFSAENVKSRPKYAYIPFSTGPRDCPGRVFAVHVVKCALAEIIRNFKVEIKPSFNPEKKKLVFMIEPVEGYPIKLIPRNNN